MELIEFAHLAEFVHISIWILRLVVHEKWVKGQEYVSQF